MPEVKTKSYTLRTENGSWLGQIVLSSDGGFFSVTDYGNLSFAWRSTGEEDFRKFILGLDVHYFSGKMYNGIAYISYGKKFQKACDLYAEKILPAIKLVLQQEIEKGIQW